VIYRLFLLLLALLSSPVAHAQQKNTAPARAVPVYFSQNGGHYQAALQIVLTAKSGSRIHYTLDGARPNENSPVYSTPIHINATTVIRAVATDGKSFSGSTTQTYLINEPNHGMPVISVTMSPSTLFHQKYGIMMDGPYTNPELEQNPKANYWTRKEYLCNVELFEDDRTCVHNGPAGFRIFGGYSRVFPQKSFVLISRKRYGSRPFDGDILPNADQKKLKYLVLRNGGSDWNGTHFRDELMSSLMDDWGVEKQGYRPAVVYLNGKYWGIYHIREKINTRFLADHNQVEQDSLDLLEHRNTVRAGSLDAYEKMTRFIETHDLSDANHYARVAATMDVDNFIDYQIAQFYCVNNDAGGNIRYWKPQTGQGKWRWIFFDMDWGFGLHNPLAYQANSFRFFTEANGPAWPNPPWSTFLLRNLLKNPQFKARFINRMCDRLNTDFNSEHVLTQVNHFKKKLEPEMPRHLKRWGLSYAEWQKSVETTKNFAIERPFHLRSHMETFFDLGAPADLEVMGATGGQVIVNGAVRVTTQNYHGNYYENQPIELEAKPQGGYRFAGWDGWGESNTIIRPNLKAGSILRLRPKFEVYNHPLAEAVIINEVCPFNKKTGDWIELYNTTKSSIKLEGWRLADAGGQFVLPSVEIGPKNFVIVCRNAQKFQSKHPLVTQPVLDGLTFGLDKAVESIMLTTPEGDMIDSMSYRVEPAAGDYTIDLLLPSLDNAQPRHWAVHLGMGSPALDNPMLFSQITGAQKDLWLRIGLGIGMLMLVVSALKWKAESRKQSAK
jgi:CotH kinase protein/Chitobiase/beta-hexosaminidase C-terminal domain/Lamin Tail Domain